MASKPLLNKFKQLKIQLHCIKADLFFLKKCKLNNVFPNFIKINCAVNNSRSDIVINKGKYIWLNMERKYLHTKLSNIELNLYYLHKQITCELNYCEFEYWIVFLKQLDETVIKCIKKKKQKLHNKFKSLVQKQNNDEQTKNTKKAKNVENYICNLSTQTFNNTELQLLNKGLNFTPQPNFTNIQNVVVDIESALYYLPDTEKAIIRKKVKPIILNYKNQNKQKQHHFSWSNTIKELKNKNVHFIKADKGNKLVILDKSEYINRMNLTLSDNSIMKLTKNPLNQMIKEANQAIKNIEQIFDIEKYKIKVSNPRLPKCYGLPKIHKSGDKMRPIISNIDSPSYKIAKWLLNEFNKLDPPNSLHIKNSFEVIDKLSNITINNDEILVSFDVISLYPSVPIAHTLKIIENWLLTINLLEATRCLFKDTTKFCMNQNQFEFNGSYYKQTSGTTMGNPLSCFLANTFMGNFETSIQAILPKIWIRYVDDIFAIVKKDQLDKFFKILNDQFDSIKFTYETEQNQVLPFLDLLLERKKNRIEFNIYRKSSMTNRYITSDSFCSYANKLAAFNSMIYRLCKIPLSVKNYINELDHIKHLANINGYSENIINKLVCKHARNIKRKKLSTFYSLSYKENIKKRVVFGFSGSLTEKLKHIFKQHDIDLVCTNNFKLSNILCNIKDKTEDINKAGIYEISCKDCELKYIGQTRRNIITRFKEHCAHIKHNQPSKSAVAQHVLENNHFNISRNENLKLLKSVNNNTKLNAWESLYIHKNRFNLMNVDKGPIISPLFYFT